MDILLINANPVVSRLMALCTRDAAYRLEEISSASQAQKEHYDIVFVDDGSYTVVTEGFVNGLDASKKIFLSSSMDTIPGFDSVIRKPFLPSQIIEVLEGKEHEGMQESEGVIPEPEKAAEFKETYDEACVSEETEKMDIESEIDRVDDPSGLTFEELEGLSESIGEETLSIFPLTAQEESKVSVEENRSESEELSESEDDAEVLAEPTDAVLDSMEIEKIKELLKMDEEEQAESDLSSPEVLTPEEYEARKVEAIKEDLIAQGLEIVDEETFVEELGVEDEAQMRQKSKKKSKKSKKLTLEELETLEMMFAYTIRKTKPKKLRKLLKGEKVKLKLKDPL